VAADDLCWMSAVDLAAAVRTADLSPVEVTRTVLDRIDRVNPAINAFCTLVPERALADARAAEDAVMRGEPLGPLHGVPISFKDLTVTAGIRTTFGSTMWRDHVPTEDAPVVERARRAGAVVLGKTNTPEFGCKGVTDNRIFGATRNPWDLTRTPGGSSGGAAAALAAGLGPLAEGSDLAGSIRVPAALCGVVGLKPTLGRVPRYPGLNGWTSFSVAGPMARTVRDVGLLLSVMAGLDERDPTSLPLMGDDFARAAGGDISGLRVAWTPDLGHAAIEREVRDICAAAAAAFAGLGGRVEDAHPPGCEEAEALFVDLTAPVRAAAEMRRPADWEDRMDPILVARIRRADGMTAIDYERATHRRTAFTRAVAAFFQGYDLLLTPATAVAPFPLTQQYPTEIAGRPTTSPLGWFPFTYPFAMTGQPAIAIPCGMTAAGLPVGLQIVGRRFGETTLLRAAAAFEAAHPWTGRRPPL
jgi:Asp-tRNA(Asn)/Glu-tRNA(Gln) amidotransferase A subunit family amidase